MPNETQNELINISDRTQITFHELQDIYNSLTGKFERISLALNKPYEVKQQDLFQLHHRLVQCCDSYGARIRNESITVYHSESFKEVFSSFDRFKLYNTSNSTPIANINIEYNILIIPAGTSKAIPYKIHMNLVSRAALREKEPGMFVGPVDFLKLFGRPDGSVSIEYVDYAAARHFMTQIEEWYNSLECATERKWLKSLQGISHWLRFIVPASLAATGTLSLGSIEAQKSVDIPANLILPIAKIASLVILLWLAGMVIGRLLELAIDRIQPISCILINIGDTRVKRNWKRSNTINACSAIIGSVVIISTNIASSFLYNLFFGNPK